MPALIVAAGAAAAGSAVAGAAVTAGLVEAGSFAFGLVSGATAFLVSAVGSSLFGQDAGPKQDSGFDSQGSFQAEARGRTQVVRSSVATRGWVLGQIQKSGPLIYAEVTGENNEYLHMVIALAPHPCEEISTVYFNDEAVGTLDGSGNVTDGRFANYARIKKHLGATDQTADSDLVAESAGIWTTAHRGQGVAYLYVRLKWSQDVYPNGIPNIKALMKGANTIYDPRDTSTGYTDNWALCVRHYLTSAAIDGGLECASDEVDDTYFSAAANICDESVTLPDASTQARYTCNGTIDTGKRPIDILKDLMTGAAGVLTYPAGAFRVFAAAYDTPSVTLTADDLRGPMQITARVPRRDLFNAVRGTFSSPDNFWQPADFPPVVNDTYAADDGGEVIYRDIVLPYTTDTYAAQRIAKISLEKSRQGITVTMPCKMTVFDLAMWDTVMLTDSVLGWSSKVFRVSGWKMAPDGVGIDLVLREESSASYDWNSGEATTVDAAPDTNLPTPWSVAAPGTPTITEELYETTGSAGVKTRAIVSWSAAADAFVVGYEAQIRDQSLAEWISLSPISLLVGQRDDLAPGYYEARVRAINSLGVRSEWSATAVKEILGLTADPADMTNFSLTPYGTEADLNWDKSTDLDVRIGGRILVRWSSKTSGTVWNDGVPIGPRDGFPGATTSGRVPHLTGTYMARAQDSSGHQSANMVSVITTEPDVTGFNAITSLTEDPAFAGTKSGVVVVDSKLQLDGTVLIDDMTDNIDDWGYIDTAGGVASSGTYDFSTYIDLGATYTSRIAATLKTLSVDTDDLIDARLDPIDDWGLVDGPEITDTDVTLYVAITDDDPAGAPTWSTWRPFLVGDYKCRALKFRTMSTSNNQNHNIQIINMGVTVDMPDREDAAAGVVSGTGTKSVSYTLSPGFKSAQILGVTAENMATGDYFTISNRTNSGFDIAFKNAAAAGVSRTFDWRAKGY